MHPDCIIHNVEQGSDEWHDLRRGKITGSGVSAIVTPTLKTANNDKTRQHVYDIAAQRITGYTEPTYYNDDMMRGHIDEVKARDLYSEHYDPVEEMGFITREIAPGVVLGYSPDGVGVMGSFGIEVKSRIMKHHLPVITSNEVPVEHRLQLQTGLLVTGWEYIDYISYCAGLPRWVIREYPRPEYQEAISAAVIEFEAQVARVMGEYGDRLSGASVVIETEREAPEQEVYFG